MVGNSRGQPKRFTTGEELISLYRQFCDEITANGFVDVPTQTSFCRWMANNFSNVDRKTIYHCLNEYFPEIKNEFENIRADTVSMGVMLGHYQPTFSIFALKNWCGWGDGKQEITATVTQTAEVTASSKLLKALLDDNTQKKD